MHQWSDQQLVSLTLVGFCACLYLILPRPTSFFSTAGKRESLFSQSPGPILRPLDNHFQGRMYYLQTEKDVHPEWRYQLSGDLTMSEYAFTMDISKLNMPTSACVRSLGQQGGDGDIGC